MHSLRVLEFDAVRQRLQLHCETALASAVAGDLQPNFDQEEVWLALDRTREAHQLLATHSPPSLGAVRDQRESVARAEKGGSLGGEELFQIADALHAMRGMRTYLRSRKDDAPLIHPYSDALPDLLRLEEALYGSLEPGGDVRDGASPALTELRRRKKTASARILEKIQHYTSGKTRELLSDPIYTVRDGRYVIPLKSENRGKIRGIVHDTSASGQTVFLEPEDVLQLGNALREVEAAEREEEQRILGELSAKVGGNGRAIVAGIEAAAEVDVLFAKARLGFEMRGVIPERLATPRIEIASGRHPLLDSEKAVPLDLATGVGASVLITGPNTGGKTVAIKTVGLFVLMAQSGMMPPATHLRLGPFSQVWADIGDEQSLEQSLSTFSGHIRNIAEALRHIQPGALALLDEVGAGTDPAEGAALAQAILLELHAKGAAILASTHYGELKAFAYNTEGFENAAMEFDQKSLRPTYRLMMGAAGASQALRIAERYGIPKSVVQAAREGLSGDHQNVSQMLERLEEAQKQARQAQSEADRRTAELRKAEESARRKLEEADEIRRTVHRRSVEAVDEALRQIRIEAADIFEQLKHASGDQAAQEQVRRRLRDLQSVGADMAAEVKPAQEAAVLAPLRKGMSVRVEGYAQVGVLLDDPRDGSVPVQMGPLKMTVPAAQIRPVDAPRGKERSRGSVTLAKAQTAATELHLRAMRAEEAMDELGRFVDDAVLAGLPSVRIVHGKGTGILRKATQEYLRKHPHVDSFRNGDASEGGQGVTIAIFK